MKNYGVNSKDSVIMLVGNKCDGRTKEVDPAEVIAYAKKKGYEYFQVSASTGENINEVFEKAFNRAVSGMEDKRKTFQ
jgi:GTPase SAR1 family protein